MVMTLLLLRSKKELINSQISVIRRQRSGLKEQMQKKTPGLNKQEMRTA